MALLATTHSLPVGRLYIYDADDNPVDCGRINEGSVQVDGDMVSDMEFDPTSCTKYETARSYVSQTGTVELELVSTSANNRGLALLADTQAIAAGTATKETTGTLAAGDLVDLGWLPAGTTSGATFTPSALTTAEDDDDPANDLTLGTHYEWYDGRQGIVKILSVSGLTQPLHFGGATRASTRLVAGDDAGSFKMIKAAWQDRRGCGAGYFLAHRAVVKTGAKVDLSKPLDGDESVTIPLSLELTSDPDQAADSTMGRLGVWVQG